MMSLWSLFRNLSCLCSSESVYVENRKFVVRGRLGEGGFAVIDLVEDKHTKRFFALKKITCHSRADEQQALDEVSYMLKLKHPNLAPCEVHSVISRGNSDDNMATSDVLIVMPYYKRGSLMDELDRLKEKHLRMNEKRIIHLLTGICRALNYLHTLKPLALAHRDIKPHNVMLHYEINNNNLNINHNLNDDVTEDDPSSSRMTSHVEIPVLVDFGSMGPARCEIKNSSDARKLQELASEKCTMPYRAPELFQVEPSSIVDEKIDIWSLGCTLYSMCFHESPFERVQQRGDSIALAAMAGNIKIPEDNQYSVSLMNVMMMMMKVDPVERPSSDELLTMIVHHHHHRQGAGDDVL
ncbi:hypothetical protein HELRODRAFT_102534 [Helobdella robusta]|uniref:non-specific serine/threonine protein kinase n=1 Tax=Helobdella robusta TaxID=6412 RepID=T1EDA1_HELRO|nr:hypothetical protein HELRODRAFT_102534 [Helobdella robusta]ESN95483.1 hypothetical protein HELRODRAFT_102534 [Helobdella robusta]